MSITALRKGSIMKKFIVSAIIACGLLVGHCEAFLLVPAEIIIKYSLYSDRSSGNSKIPHKDCYYYVLKILKPFMNELDTVTVTCKAYKKIRSRALSFMKTKNAYKRVAAKAVYEGIKQTRDIYNEEVKKHPLLHLGCQLCSEEIVGHRKELACSHVFCMGCLRDWYIEQWMKEDSVRKGTLGCPTCGKRISTKIQEELGQSKLLSALRLIARDKTISRFIAKGSVFVLGNQEACKPGLLRALAKANAESSDSESEHSSSESLTDPC